MSNDDPDLDVRPDAQPVDGPVIKFGTPGTLHSCDYELGLRRLCRQTPRSISQQTLISPMQR